MGKFEQIGVIPVDYAVLRTLYSDYSFPRNKIARVEQEGEIIRVKRGMYVVSPNVSKQLLSIELIAILLYDPLLYVIGFVCRQNACFAILKLETQGEGQGLV